MNIRDNQIYEFAHYSLDPVERKLFRNGQEVRLRPKLFDLLLGLVQRPGQALETGELMDLVWPDVEIEPQNLVVSISELRKELGDDRYIETVSRHGYRFAAEVRVLRKEAPGGPGGMEEPPPGGAMPQDSRFYITRETDAEFHQAIARRDSLVLIKGARQVGKTSLLARGLERARESGSAVVQIDLQRLTADVFGNVEKLLRTLAEMMAHDLSLKTSPHQKWDDLLSAGTNFERYLRHEALEKIAPPLVWGLDEIDRLFEYPYARELFGLFRSWHNLRALDPSGPWRRLTLAMAYATEAHLFITDLNQSPFNVGTRLMLEDFRLEQVAELNRRHGSPLRNDAEVEGFFTLVGGHPYLAQRGLYEAARRGLDLAAIEEKADRDEGIFGEHLRRMLVSLERNPELCDAVRGVLQGKPGLKTTSFYHLRSAGVLAGESAQAAQPRCRLYAQFLGNHLL